MDYKKIITGLLSTAYKVDEGKLSEIFEKTDATEDSILKDILSIDKTRIGELGKGKLTEEDGKAKFQEGYKKAKKETMEAFEKELKEAHGIADDVTATGQDLIDHIITAKSAEASKGKKDIAQLTEDEIKGTPAYRKLEKEFKTQLKQAETDYSTKLQEKETEYNRTTNFSKFSTKALEKLAGLNPILPKNAQVAATHQRNFLNSFQDLDITANEDGSFTFKTKDGKVLTDEHGHLMDLEAVVKSRADNHFEFNANNGGSNSGNSNDAGKTTTTGGGQGPTKYPDGYMRPKSVEEYSKVVTDTSIPLETRQQYSKAYNDETAATSQ